MKEAFIHSEIYNDRVMNWRTMSVNIFRHEICACIMLTDICNEIILGNANPQRFTIDTAKYIRETKTDDEYSEWLFEQEKKYKTRTKKAYSDKEKDGVKNGNNK